MKHKIKEITLDEISFTKTPVDNLINVKYHDSSLEFQTPKVIIESVIKENGHEYLILKIIGNQACKLFCSKILELEKYFSVYVGNTIKTVFDNDCFTVKIPFKYSKPCIKVYKNESLFNYYHLTKDL